MIILAIDTSGHHGGIALARDETLLEEAILHAPDGFGHHLFGAIESLLVRHALSPAQIGCFAAASGPGSFTGVRVALAAVKGLAEAAGRPAAAVSNLQALAYYGKTSLRAPLIDARRDEIYGGLYDDTLNPLAPEQVAPLETWLATLPAGGVEFISSEFAPFAAAIIPSRPTGKITIAPASLAPAVAAIARNRMLQGLSLDPAAMDANYVRRSDAELHWREA